MIVKGGEIVAIRAACRELKDFQLVGCDLYTSCEPCPMCLGAIYWARPDHVYYASSRTDAAAAGFDDDFIYSQIRFPPSTVASPCGKCCNRRHKARFKHGRKW